MNRKGTLPVIILIISLLTSIIMTTIALNSGHAYLFQNLFFLPIIIACFFWRKNGFYISIFISLAYFLTVVLFSSHLVLIEVFLRTLVFISIAFVVYQLVNQKASAEELLKKSEEKYRHIDDASKDLIYSYDLKSRFTHANKSLCKLLNLEENQIIGKSHYELGFPKEQCDEWDKLHQKVVETNTTVFSETATPISGGEIEFFEIILNPIHGDNGSIIGIAGVTRNITDRKKNERKIHSDEQRLKSIVNILQTESESIQQFLDYTLDEAIKLTRSRIGYIYLYSEVNKQFILNSWSKEVMKECEVVNPQTCYELDRTGIWGEVVRQRKPIILNDFQADHPLKKGYPEGHVMLKSFMSIPVFEGNKIVAVVGVGNKEGEYENSDVLQLTLLMDSVWKVVRKKETEEKLKNSENKLFALFNSMTEMVAIHELVFDENDKAINYRIIDCNEAYSRITGIPHDYAVGKIATELYNSEEPPYFDIYSNVVVTGVPTEFEIFYPAMEKHFRISAVPLPKRQFATVTTDLTDIKQAQELIIAKNQELENYIYIASHDLRSPLVNIQGFGQRIQKETDLINEIIENCNLSLDEKSDINKIIHEKIPKSLNYIFSGVSKMEALVNGLLQVSRTGRVKMSIVQLDMNKLIQEVILPFNYQIESTGCEIVAAELPACYGDANLLNQMFSNLIGNAIKYRDKNRKQFIKISGEDNFNKVIYKVSDNGVGIEERHLNKIWDVFYRIRTDSDNQGEGIGLTLVKRIVEKHKGRIKVESEPGKGSVFIIELNKQKFDE